MKEKIYYFQEKSNDILDLQDDFTAEEIGMLFILKAAYFKYSGELKEENLCQRCKFFGDKEKLILLTKKIFCLVDGVLTNQKWLAEISGIKERSEKRANAANTRWGKTKNPKRTQSEPKQTQSVIETQFESFWNLYDKKTGRPDAEKKFKAALKKDTFENIIAGLERYIKARGSDSQYWKHPSTWLNQECWKDEYQPKQEQKPTQSSGSYLDFLTGGKNV